MDITSVLPVPIVYAVAFSIIVIAFAILIWLIITILFGTLLFKKMNGLTKNISDLVKTLNEKGKLVADQTTETIKSYQLPARTVNESGKGFKFAPIVSTIVGLSSLVYEVLKVTALFKKRKEKSNG